VATNTDNPFGKLANYVLDPQQEEQKQLVQQPAQYAQAATLQQPAQPQIQQPMQPRQQPAPSMFGQPQQPQPAQPRQTTMTPVTAGQRYTQMLQQNVPQAQAVASGLAKQVTTPAAAAKRGFEEAQKRFAKTVAEKGLTRSTQRTQELINKAAAGQQLTPTEFGELQKISTTRESFEEGTRPEDFMQLQEYVTALEEAQKARQYAGLTGTGAGRQQLLQQATRTPAYTSGQALMDALLAGGVAPAAEQLQQIQQRFGPAQDELAVAQQKMAEEAQRVKSEESAEIEAAYKDIQDLLDAKGTGALADLEKTIQDRVVEQNKKVEETNKLIDTVVPKIGSVLGDTDEEKRFMELLGIKPGSTLARQIELAPKDVNLIGKLKEVNPQTVTSQEEIKKLEQLYKIADIARREKPELAVQEGEDLGTLAQQAPSIDVEKVASAAETQKKNILADIDTTKQNITSSAANYKLAPGLSLGAALKDANTRVMKKAQQGWIYPDKFSFDYLGKNTAKEIDSLLNRAETEIKNLNKKYENSGYKVQKGKELVTPKLSTAVTDKEIDSYISQIVSETGKKNNKTQSYINKMIDNSKKAPGVRNYFEKMLRLQKAQAILTRKSAFDVM